jgi:hypothetical protein
VDRGDVQAETTVEGLSALADAEHLENEGGSLRVGPLERVLEDVGTDAAVLVLGK